MTPSTRQSGAVHIMFLIITIILALAGWGMWFGEKSKNEELAATSKEAELSEAAATSEVYQLRKGYEVVAKAVGGIPATLPPALPIDQQSEYEALVEAKYAEPIRKKVREIIKFFQGDRSQDTLFDAYAPAEAMVTRLESEKSQLMSQLATARADKAAAEKANDDMITAQNTELANKNEEMNQLRQKNARQEQALESQKDALSNELRDITSKFDEAAKAHTKEIVVLRDFNARLDRDVRDYKLQERTHRERNLPDGQVTGVNYKEGTCYINIGTKHGLRRGTRFQVYRFAKGRVKQFFGYIVVRDTERDRSLCAIENGARPMRQDYITSPAFDAEKSRTFYFLGNLPGRFNNQTATRILGQYGMKVADKFNLNVDFIVLGENPEMPEEGEEPDPNWFKKTQAYSDAIRWGVEMIRAEDLETYLKY